MQGNEGMQCIVCLNNTCNFGRMRMIPYIIAFHGNGAKSVDFHGTPLYYQLSSQEARRGEVFNWKQTSLFCRISVASRLTDGAKDLRK